MGNERRTLTVGIDSRTLLYPGSVSRGIGNYTYYHVAALMKLKPEWRFLLYVEEPSVSEAVQQLTRMGNAEVRTIIDAEAGDSDILHIPDPMGLYPGFDSPFRIIPDVPISVLVHDLIPLVLKEDYLDRWPEMDQVTYRTRLRQLTRTPACILTNSEFTRRDLHKHTGIPLENITAVLAGLNTTGNKASRPRDEVLRTLGKWGIKQPFFLSVGSLEQRKGFDITIKALVLAQSRAPLNLVVAGATEPELVETYKNAIESNGIPGVTFTGFVEREELEDLYEAAEGLVFPSKYEGFGFRVLEAMARGCPVVTCNTSSIPEVAGKAALMVNPDYVEVAGAMAALYESPELRESLIREGLVQAKKFTWEDVAAKTAKVWEKRVGVEESNEVPKENAS